MFIVTFIAFDWMLNSITYHFLQTSSAPPTCKTHCHHICLLQSPCEEILAYHLQACILVPILLQVQTYIDNHIGYIIYRERKFRWIEKMMSLTFCVVSYLEGTHCNSLVTINQCILQNYHDWGSSGSRFARIISSISSNVSASGLTFACFVNISSNFAGTNLQ